MKTETVYPELGSLGLGQRFRFVDVNGGRFVNSYVVIGVRQDWLAVEDKDGIYFVDAEYPAVLFEADPSEKVEVLS